MAATSPHFLPALAGIPPGPSLGDALGNPALLSAAAHVASAGVEAGPETSHRVSTLPFE